MPSKKPTKLWAAPPHTLAKLAMLRYYLAAYFAILGRRTDPSREILYIDGFAGPDEYTDHPHGSPTVAVTAAAKAVASAGDGWLARGVNCVFVDREPWIVEHCRRKLAELPEHDRVWREVRRGRFDAVLPTLIEQYPSHFRGDAPLFVFADPFGATGAPFWCIEQILADDRSELFLNFDSDGLIRIHKSLKAGSRKANATHLSAIFGDESWRDELRPDANMATLARQALELFKRRLHSIPGVKYVFAFEMQKHEGSPDYHLVFAGKHRLGLEKMKEAMRAIARDQGDFVFCDASFRTGSLFRFDRPEDWASVVHNAFAGQTASAEAVWDFVLNETLLVNAKAVLQKLENDKVVSIRRRPGVGTGRDLKLMETITFKPGPYAPPQPKGGGEEQGGLFDGPQEQH